MMMVGILQHKRRFVNGFYLDRLGINKGERHIAAIKHPRLPDHRCEGEGFTRSGALVGATPGVRMVLKEME